MILLRNKIIWEILKNEGVLEQAQMRQSARLMNTGFFDAEDKVTLFRLEKEDFYLPSLMLQKEIKRSIGFIS